MASKTSGPRPVAQNRKARHDYEILDTSRPGSCWRGARSSRLREGKVQLRDAYARVQDGEIWLHGVHVSP